MNSFESKLMLIDKSNKRKYEYNKISEQYQKQLEYIQKSNFSDLIDIAIGFNIQVEIKTTNPYDIINEIKLLLFKNLQNFIEFNTDIITTFEKNIYCRNFTEYKYSMKFKKSISIDLFNVFIKREINIFENKIEDSISNLNRFDISINSVEISNSYIIALDITLLE